MLLLDLEPVKLLVVAVVVRVQFLVVAEAHQSLRESFIVDELLDWFLLDDCSDQEAEVFSLDHY